MATGTRIEMGIPMAAFPIAPAEGIASRRSVSGTDLPALFRCRDKARAAIRTGCRGFGVVETDTGAGLGFCDVGYKASPKTLSEALDRIGAILSTMPSVPDGTSLYGEVSHGADDHSSSSFTIGETRVGRLHAETRRFIDSGDVDGLAAAMRADVYGLAERLARRAAGRL